MHPYRTYSELMGLLAEVDEVLGSEIPPENMYALYVIGGVAIGNTLGDRLTQDVDVVTETIPSPVLRAARTVAQRHGLADNWINNQAARMIDADLPVQAFETVYEGGALLVRAAKPETLLALKLMSGRGKDIPDILDLAQYTGIVHYEDLMKLCDEIFSSTAGYGHERSWISSVSRDIHALLQEMRLGKSVRQRIAARRPFSGHPGREQRQQSGDHREPTRQQRR